MKQKRIKTACCEKAAKYICVNLDEHLNSPRCRQIKKHLKECGTCSKNLRDLKAVISFYRKSTVPRLPRAVHKQLMEVLHSKMQ